MARRFVTALRSAVVGALVTTALVPGAAADLPPVGTITRSYTRPGANRPAVVAGVLSGPGDGSPVLQARFWLSSTPDIIDGVAPTTLRLDRVRFRKRGAIVRFQQGHAGLDVIGGTVVVRLDEDGRVRWAASGTTPIPASFSTEPLIGATDAVTALGGIARTSPWTRLVILGDPIGDHPRLAWEVDLGRDLMNLQALRGYVDAKTGAVLLRQDDARHAAQHLARVFPENPVVTPLTQVEPLEDLPVGATRLAGPRVVTASCIDLRQCEEFQLDTDSRRYHFCTPSSLAHPGADDTFLHIFRPSSDTNALDPFAEVQLYWHLTEAWDAFRGWAEDEDFMIGDRPISALANFRLPESVDGAECTAEDAPATSQLGPYDGAVYLPPDGDEEPWLVFGQGTIVDTAYDGDLVTHELAHAVIGLLSPLGLAARDPFGLDPTPAALHEGYADYFAAARAGDAEIAEYAGGGLGSTRASGALRSALNDLGCPSDLDGNAHHDGQMWLGALWTLRQSRPPGERQLVDASVFAAMESLGELDTLAVAQTLTIAELELAMGDDVAALAAAIFHARGLDGCASRTVSLDLDEVRPIVEIAGAPPGGVAPAPVQFLIQLPFNTDEIRIDFAESDIRVVPGEPALPELSLLLKRGSEPIYWSWPEGALTNDAIDSGAVFPNPITGPGSGRVTGWFPAGLYRLQLVNLSRATTVLHSVRFSAVESAGPSDDAGIPSDAGADAALPGVDHPGDCNCRAGATPSTPPAGAIGLLGLALLLVRRRG